MSDRPLTRALAVALSLSTGIATSGCATLFNEVPQHIPVTSDPAGATVEVDGQVVGTTPLEVALPVNDSHQVTVTSPGYPAQTRMLVRSANVGFIVLDVVLGLVPLAVDFVTGDLYDLAPAGLHFQFAPIQAPPAAPIVLVPEVEAAPPRSLRRAGPPAGAPARSLRRADPPAGARASQHCCVNGAYYECPDAAAVARCAPPQLASCLMGCGADFNCPDQCLASYPPDPSACTRAPASDAQCQ